MTAATKVVKQRKVRSREPIKLKENTDADDVSTMRIQSDDLMPEAQVFGPPQHQFNLTLSKLPLKQSIASHSFNESNRRIAEIINQEQLIQAYSAIQTNAKM